jgi:WD40 repeat protein
MHSFALDRRRFLLTSASVCLGGPATNAQPKDDATKARLAVKLNAPDGIDCIDQIAFAPDRSLVALFQSDGKIRLWDTATGNWRITLAGHRFEYADLFALVDNGKTVLAWNGIGTGACFAWDVKTGEQRTVFNRVGRDDQDEHWAAAAALDGKRIATVHEGGRFASRVRMWDSATGKELWDFNNAAGKVMIYAVAFSPDAKALALATEDGKVRLLDSKTGKETAVLEDSKDIAHSVEWSADGKQLAVVQIGAKNGTRVAVWEVATGKIAGTVGPFDRGPWFSALAPDGKHLATLDNELVIWPVPGKKPVATVRVSGRRGLAWSADGKSLLVLREYPRTLELLTFDLADLLPKK